MCLFLLFIVNPPCFFFNFFYLSSSSLLSTRPSVVLLGAHVVDALALAWTLLVECRILSGREENSQTILDHINVLESVTSSELGKPPATRPFDVRFLGSESDRKYANKICKRPQDIKPAPRPGGLSGTRGPAKCDVAHIAGDESGDDTSECGRVPPEAEPVGVPLPYPRAEKSNTKAGRGKGKGRGGGKGKGKGFGGASLNLEGDSSEDSDEDESSRMSDEDYVGTDSSKVEDSNSDGGGVARLPVAKNNRSRVARGREKARNKGKRKSEGFHSSNPEESTAFNTARSKSSKFPSYPNGCDDDFSGSRIRPRHNPPSAPLSFRLADPTVMSTLMEGLRGMMGIVEQTMKSDAIGSPAPASLEPPIAHNRCVECADVLHRFDTHLCKVKRMTDTPCNDIVTCAVATYLDARFELEGGSKLVDRMGWERMPRERFRTEILNPFLSRLYFREWSESDMLWTEWFPIHFFSKSKHWDTTRFRRKSGGGQ